MIRVSAFRHTAAYSPNETSWLFRPADTSSATTRRLVVIAPGYNQSPDAYNPPNSAGYRYQWWSTLQAGYPILVPACGGSSTWGNDTSQTNLGAAITWATGLGGIKSDAVVLWGVSMGALTVLNWGRANPTKVKGYVLSIPAVAMQLIHDQNRSSLATVIETAYGGSSPYTTALSTHDPMANKSSTSYTGKPGMIVYNTTDPVVLTTDVSTFITSPGPTTWTTTSVSSPTGHDDTGYDYSGIPAWITANSLA